MSVHSGCFDMFSKILHRQVKDLQSAVGEGIGRTLAMTSVPPSEHKIAFAIE